MRFCAFEAFFPIQKHKKRSFCAFTRTNDRQNYQIIVNLGNSEGAFIHYMYKGQFRMNLAPELISYS